MGFDFSIIEGLSFSSGLHLRLTYFRTHNGLIFMIEIVHIVELADNISYTKNDIVWIPICS